MGESTGIGSTIGGYGVEAVLASDRAGVVYRATQTARGRTVALRVIAPQVALSEVFRERFRGEASSLVFLRHPNVLPVFEAGEVDGRLYIASRYLEGQSLRTMIERAGRLTVAQAVHVAAHVAAALDAAHDRGLVHRGVDPSRILVAGEGDSPDIYLTDFVITDDTAEYGGILMARGPLVPPTMDYAAPEQVEGGPADLRADVYALGCVLYHALTGRVPFAKGSESDRAKARLLKEPPSAATLGLDELGRFDELFARALAKDVASRYESAGELARAALGVSAEQDGPAEQSERSKRRRVAESWRRMVEAGTMASSVRLPTPAQAGGAVRRSLPAPVAAGPGQDDRSDAAAKERAARPAPQGDAPGPSATKAEAKPPEKAADATARAPKGSEPQAPPTKHGKPEPSAAKGGKPEAAAAKGDQSEAPPAKNGGAGPPARTRAGKEVPPPVDPTELREAHRRRRLPVALLAVVAAVLLGLGALAALGAFSGDSGSERAGGSRPAGERDAAAGQGGEQERPAAEEPARPERGGGGRERGGDGRDRSERARPRARASRPWPAGRSGYTAVIFASPTDQAQAGSRARAAAAIGLRSGVLRSDSHSSLPPGFWVAFGGIFRSQAEAQRAADRARAKGLASRPYIRFVSARSQ